MTDTVTDTPATLKGPSEIDNFRSKTHQYIDPLPADDIAPATDDVFPGVTGILGPLMGESGDHLERYNYGLVADKAIINAPGIVDDPNANWRERLVGYPAVVLQGHSDRGTAVHKALESVIEGTPLNDWDDINGLHIPYQPAIATVRAHMLEAGVRLVASEIIVYDRTRGYAGQADAIMEWPNGFRAIVDWKSRKVGKAATKRPKEAIQGGAYSSAGYWIVNGPDGPMRMLPLEIHGGMIVSMAPENEVRYYPFNIERARLVWDAALTFRNVKETTPEPFSRCLSAMPKTPVQAVVETTATEVEPEALAPVIPIVDAPSSGAPIATVTDISEAAAARLAKLPTRIDPVGTNGRDEGDTLDLDEVRTLFRSTVAKLRRAELDYDACMKRVTVWTQEAARTGYPWRIGEGPEFAPTERKFAIYQLAFRSAFSRFDDAAIAHLLTYVAATPIPAGGVGRGLSLLTIEQASTALSLMELACQPKGDIFELIPDPNTTGDIPA